MVQILCCRIDQICSATTVLFAPPGTERNPPEKSTCYRRAPAQRPRLSFAAEVKKGPRQITALFGFMGLTTASFVLPRVTSMRLQPPTKSGTVRAHHREVHRRSEMGSRNLSAVHPKNRFGETPDLASAVEDELTACTGP